MNGQRKREREKERKREREREREGERREQRILACCFVAPFSLFYSESLKVNSDSSQWLEVKVTELF
jgi:hypothetical protein